MPSTKYPILIALFILTACSRSTKNDNTKPKEAIKKSEAAQLKPIPQVLHVKQLPLPSKQALIDSLSLYEPIGQILNKEFKDTTIKHQLIAVESPDTSCWKFKIVETTANSNKFHYLLELNYIKSERQIIVSDPSSPDTVYSFDAWLEQTSTK